MPNPIKLGRKERMTFSKINEVAEMPNLIQIQTDSYDWFVREGLREVFGTFRQSETMRTIWFSSS